MRTRQLSRAVAMLVLLGSTSGMARAQDGDQAAPTNLTADPLSPVEAVDSEGSAATAEADPTAVAPAADEALAAMSETFGIDGLAPGKFRWAADIPTDGDLKVIVSLTDQLAFVYRGDRLIGVSTVSSGMENHETPTGVFPVLGKEKDHRSAKYDDAPMPYMLRLNDYGVALHGGRLPGYPASHGCVRLPMAFAAKLFMLAERGTEVIIEA